MEVPFQQNRFEKNLLALGTNIKAGPLKTYCKNQLTLYFENMNMRRNFCKLVWNLNTLMKLNLRKL